MWFTVYIAPPWAPSLRGLCPSHLCHLQTISCNFLMATFTPQQVNYGVQWIFYSPPRPCYVRNVYMLLSKCGWSVTCVLNSSPRLVNKYSYPYAALQLSHTTWCELWLIQFLTSSKIPFRQTSYRHKHRQNDCWLLFWTAWIISHTNEQ